MNKSLPYIILSAIIILIIAAALLYKPSKEFDDRVTLSYKDKRPYATYICYNTIDHFFKTDKIAVEKDAIDVWKENKYPKGSLLFIVTNEFNANDNELEAIYKFIENGNYVFISSAIFNETSRDFFNVTTAYDYDNIYGRPYDTSLTKATSPYYKDTASIKYLGKTSNNFFKQFDNERFILLGKNDYKNDIYIKARAGEGTLFLHTNPLLFTNYFLTQSTTNKYYQEVLSAIPNNISSVIWDDYYLYRREDYSEKVEPSMFKVLFNTPGFKWAFYLAIGLFCLYALIHFKRKQRFLIKQNAPKNESLYFAETIGRLYFEKGDHFNLANKMIAYLLEHIRSKYLLNTSFINSEFTEKLATKSGYSLTNTEQLVTAIQQVQMAESISQQQLNELYLIIQNFYKHTN